MTRGGVDVARVALGVAAALLLIVLSSCRCQPQRDDVVARLVELRGPAAKELADKRGAWGNALVGASFAVGDAVRTEGGTTARVAMVKGGTLALGERTTVRFLASGVVTRHLVVETGEAEIEPGSSGMQIETLIGMAELEPGSRVRISAKTGGQTTVDVLIGQAEFEATDARAARSLKAGQRFRVSIGSAELDAVEPLPPPDGGIGDARASDAATQHDGPSAQPIQVEVHGAGAKTSPLHGAPLAPLGEGTATLAAGARVVVPDDVTVDLTRGDERATVLGGSDIEIGAAGEPLVRLDSGRLMLRSSSAGERTRVPGGSVELVKAGPGDVQAEIRVDKKATRVVSNRAELLLRGKGASATVGAGQSGSLDARGEATVDEPRATTADVTIAAGESATIHSTKGVATVRVALADCPSDALVEVTSRGVVHKWFERADEPATGIFRLASGSHDYAASCVGGAAVQRGTLRIIGDSGMAHLAIRAATNVVDADGRHYHVLYQGRLPRMTFHWPTAPPDAFAVLHAVPTSGAERTFPAAGGKAELKEGSMAEGTYRFWFDVVGHPEKRSPDTSLVIGFDNAAPAAEIRSPVDGEPLTRTIHVSGVAGDGASVSVAGVPLPLDGQSRFSGDVPGPSADNRVLAVRIAHPTRGVHYYVRTFGAAAASAP